MFLLAQSKSEKFPKLTGSYLGQKPPGTTPVVFLPELFNMYTYLHGKLVFSPDGKEVFWVVTSVIDKRMLIKQKSDGVWAPPVDSFMKIQYNENGPCYSADGKRLYYQSRAPLSGNGASKDIDIWYRETSGDSWSTPHNVGQPVNSSEDESQPWVASDGSIFFCRDNKTAVKGVAGGSDIFYAKYANGKYAQPVLLGAEINSEYGETEATVAADSSYMLFISNRPGGFSSRMNLYVSFRTPTGGWTKARCISHELKIENIWFPTLSYDGKYLFFCGGYPGAEGYSNSDYYWIDTMFINDLKQ